jgi:sporulation protein YlmC with PRC-barrel domain
MAIVEDLRSWIGKDVLDSGGGSLGKFRDVYFDVESDEPVFLVVDPGRRHDNLLAPAWNASVTPEVVRVAYTSEALDGAPTLALEGDLDTDTEQKLFAFFQVEYAPSQTGSGRRLMRH